MGGASSVWLGGFLLWVSFSRLSSLTPRPTTELLFPSFLSLSLSASLGRSWPCWLALPLTFRTSGDIRAALYTLSEAAREPRTRSASALGRGARLTTGSPR